MLAIAETDGPRGTSLTDMLSQSNNLWLLKGLVRLPLQVRIPAASSAPGLVLIRPCGELIQLTGWTESTKEQSEYFLATLAIWKCLREVSGQAQAEGEGQDQVAVPRKRAGESSTVLFGRSKLCERLAWSAHLALSSVQLIAVNNRINTQYCWMLPFYVSSGSKGWEMFGFVSL